MPDTQPALNQTPIRSFHEENGAQLVEFAGWEMPLRYGSVIEEHTQCRAGGAVFDVSHMGRVWLKGLHAKRLLERTCTRRIGNLKNLRARYGFITNESGGVMDDVIVNRMDDDEFMVVVNGSNREKIVAHWQAVAADRGLKVTIDDRTMKTAMLAAQGPAVQEVLSTVSNELPALKRFQLAVKNLLVAKIIVSRTGYTGEDGVEIIFPANMVGMLMKVALGKMDPKDPNSPLKPAGLAARDTLRIEAGLPLYGHELGEDISALAANMPFALSLDKSQDADGETFIGQEALIEQQQAGGPPRRLVGLELEGKRTARQGAKVLAGDEEVGEVTSGCLSPTLGKSIAMAYLNTATTEPGTNLTVAIGTGTPATVVPLPFYKRAN